MNSQIGLLQAEIETSPTEFSFNILRPQLFVLSRLIEGEFKKVINQIYSTTCQLRDSIAHRNIKKERNTMLFGHIKTLKDWDY